MPRVTGLGHVGISVQDLDEPATLEIAR